MGLGLVFCGNKWCKFKYNFVVVRFVGYVQLFIFGGVFFNYIVVVVGVGVFFGFKIIGVICGEVFVGLNFMFRFVWECGMYLYFVDRFVFW